MWITCFKLMTTFDLALPKRAKAGFCTFVRLREARITPVSGEGAFGPF